METKSNMKTSYGLEFNLVSEVNPAWGDYDKLVARCHLKQVEVIIVDAKCGQPIDNEYDLEEIYRLVKEAKNTGITKTDISQ